MLLYHWKMLDILKDFWIVLSSVNNFISSCVEWMNECDGHWFYWLPCKLSGSSSHCSMLPVPAQGCTGTCVCECGIDELEVFLYSELPWQQNPFFTFLYRDPIWFSIITKQQNHMSIIKLINIKLIKLRFVLSMSSFIYFLICFCRILRETMQFLPVLFSRSLVIIIFGNSFRQYQEK